ncbi:unnamed protein product [Diamesa serratosioi]
MSVNKDIAVERENCTFSVHDFTSWYHDGVEKLEKKRFLDNYFLNDPECQQQGFADSYLSYKDQYEEAVKKSVVFMKKSQKLQASGKYSENSDDYLPILGGQLGSRYINQGSPFSGSLTMFLSAIKNMGTPEQGKEWLPRTYDCKIIGAYAQTELGHGTFVRGLETTATYDEKTEEFVMNSPTKTSYKWWPGGLGHTANHSIVVAQLYIKDKHHGVQLFIVPIRCEKTHKPLAGIKVGDIGNKYGFSGVNNGFLGMNNVRIPRKNMLMKNAQVLADGKFIKSLDAKLNYGTMVLVRVIILQEMGYHISKAVTIATRYSTVRRQSPINPDEPEVKVLDHVTQQMKLFPLIAKAIVFKLTSDSLWSVYNQTAVELKSGNLERLPELHALSCCLKSVCTTEAAQSVEICRRATGGHGYLQSSGFPDIYTAVTAAETYEGENTILLLQTARYLMKVWNQVTQGDFIVPPTVAYLVTAFKFQNKLVKWDETIPGIIKAFEAVAAGKINKATNNLQECISNGNSLEVAANKTSIELAACSETHCKVYLLSCGYKLLLEASEKTSPALGSILMQLCELYAVDLCLKSLGDLLQFVEINSDDIGSLQKRLKVVLSQLRPNAIGLVDGFDIPDGILNSVLGHFDGNVYEHIFKAAMISPLNQEQVNKSFERHIKPFIQSNL